MLVSYNNTNYFLQQSAIMEKVICKKSRKANWDYIGGEVFFGLLFVISLLLAILIPL